MMPGETHSKTAGIACEAAGTCQNCTALQQNLNEYVAALIALKQKIIDSDHLLAEYQQKCQELQFTERENDTLRCQLEKMLQKISPQESNQEQLESIKAELAEKTSTLKIYQQTQLEYGRFKEECEKSDLVKKKLEAKLKKVEESAEKNLKDFKQMKLEKKVLEKELKKMQKKLDDFQSSKRKKGMKNTHTQTREAFANVDTQKMKFLLEELWECIDSTTDKNIELHLLDNHLHKDPDMKTRDRKNGKRGRSLKSSDDCTVPPSHSSPLVVSQMQKAPSQLPLKQLHEHKNSEEGTADCNGDSAFYEDKTADFLVPRDFIDSYSSVSDVDRESEFLQILDWAKPLPPLLSPIQFSPTQDYFGEMTDSSDREEDDCTQPFLPNCSIECDKSDENPACDNDQTDHRSPEDSTAAFQEKTGTQKDVNDVENPKETVTYNLAERAALCYENSNQAAPTAEMQEKELDLIAKEIQEPSPLQLKEAVCESTSHSHHEKGEFHGEPSQSMPGNVSTNDMDIPLLSDDKQTGEAIPECNNSAPDLKEEYQESSSVSVPKVERDMSRHTFDPIQRPKELASDLEIQEERSDLVPQSNNINPNKDDLDFPCSSSANSLGKYDSEISSEDKCANAMLPSPVTRNVDCLDHSSIAECETLFDRLNLVSSSHDIVADNSLASSRERNFHDYVAVLPVQSKNDTASDKVNIKSNDKDTNQMHCTKDMHSNKPAKHYSEGKIHTADCFPSISGNPFSEDIQGDKEQADSTSLLTVSAPLVNEQEEEPMQWEPTESKGEHLEPELEEHNETIEMKHNQTLNLGASDKLTSSSTKQDCTEACGAASCVQNDHLLSLDSLENKILQQVSVNFEDEKKPVSTTFHSQDSLNVSGKTYLQDGDSQAGCKVNGETVSHEFHTDQNDKTVESLNNSDSASFYNKLSEAAHKIEMPVNSRLEANVVTAELDSPVQEKVNSESKDIVPLNSMNTSNKLEILPSDKEGITLDLLQTDGDISTKSNSSGELHNGQCQPVSSKTNDEFATQSSTLPCSTEAVYDLGTEKMLKDNINSLELDPSSSNSTTNNSEAVTESDGKGDSTSHGISDKPTPIEIDAKLSPAETNLSVTSDTGKPVVCEEDSITCPPKESHENIVPAVPAEELANCPTKTQLTDDDMKIHEELCIKQGTSESSDESEDDTPVRKVNYKSISQNKLFGASTNVKSSLCRNMDNDSDVQIKNRSVTESPSKTDEVAKSVDSLKEDLNVIRAKEGECPQVESAQEEKPSNTNIQTNVACPKELGQNVVAESKPVTSPTEVPDCAEVSEPKNAASGSVTAQPEKAVLSSDREKETSSVTEPSDGKDTAVPAQSESLNNDAEQAASNSFVEANCRKTAPCKNLIWNFHRSDSFDRAVKSKRKVPLERKTVLLGDKSLGSSDIGTDSDQREHNGINGLTSAVHNTQAVRKEDCPPHRVTRSRNQSQNASVGQTILANADTSTSTEHSPETLNKVRSEMGPPLPPLLGPLLATPPRSLRPISPIMSSSSRSSLPSPLDDLISPLRETPVPPLMSPLSDSRRRKSPIFNTPSPSEKTNRRILSSPLQFCAATPKHALPVPGRLPISAAGNSGTSVQENSVKILDTMYPELSARARTLNILKGNVQLNRCLPGDCRNVPVSQISGFKAITSTSTAFIKTGSCTKASSNKDKQKDCESLQLSSSKRPLDPKMPKSAKRLRLDSESPVTENLKDCFTVPASKGQLEEKMREPCDVSVYDSDPLKGTVKDGQPDDSIVVNALKKIEELCFDLLPVIRSHVHVGTIPSVPVMRNEEKEVVYEFSHTKKDLSGHFLHTILKTLKAGRTSLDSKYLQALCRVYVGLCRQLGDLERARVLCYNIIKEGFPEPEKLLLFAVSTWSEMFSFHGVISKAMQTLLKNLAKEEVLSCLSAYLNWEKSPPMNISTILSSILMAIQVYPDVKFQTSEQYGEDLPDHIWEYVFAVDLLCCHRKWTWTHDSVISKELWPILDKWVKLKKGHVNIAYVPDITVATVLRLVGRLCQMGLKEGFVSAVKNIGSVILAFIAHAKEEGMPWGVQLASVYMLHDLGPCDPVAIHKTLHAWKESATNTVPPAVTSCIAQVASLCNPKQ